MTDRREALSLGLAAVGLGMVVTAAFLWSWLLGLAVLGAGLFLIGVLLGYGQ